MSIGAKKYLQIILTVIISVAIFIWWLDYTLEDIGGNDTGEQPATSTSELWQPINNIIEGSRQIFKSTSTRESLREIQNYIASSTTSTNATN